MAPISPAGHFLAPFARYVTSDSARDTEIGGSREGE